MVADAPAILVAGEGGARDGRDRSKGLPFGPFDPLAHHTFEIGLRAWVEAQTGLRVGYVEQLYTFGDRGRHAAPRDAGPHVVSVGYLALIRMPENVAALTRIGSDMADLALRNMRIAGRADITRLARQLRRTEDKLERVLQEVEALRDERSRERTR